MIFSCPTASERRWRRVGHRDRVTTRLVPPKIVRDHGHPGGGQIRHPCGAAARLPEPAMASRIGASPTRRSAVARRDGPGPCRRSPSGAPGWHAARRLGRPGVLAAAFGSFVGPGIRRAANAGPLPRAAGSDAFAGPAERPAHAFRTLRGRPRDPVLAFLPASPADPPGGSRERSGRRSPGSRSASTHRPGQGAAEAHQQSIGREAEFRRRILAERLPERDGQIGRTA